MKTINTLASVSLAMIFLVILAGSIVRMTGSGMGCPDWPKCFGHLIPPTSEEQVLWRADHDYKKGQMIVRDEALWSAASDFTSREEYNAENWTKYEKHDYAIFNATHTWVEYVNRLIGVLSGIPILLFFVLSLFKLKEDYWLAILGAATLAMLGYEAWLGKLVVDGNLVPNSITKHMFGSMVIVALLVVSMMRSSGAMKKEVRTSFRVLLMIAIVMLGAQILLGTQVREQIDEIALQTADRTLWIGLLDHTILIHRSSSIAIFLLLTWLFWRNWRNEYAVHSVGMAFLFVILEITVGASMYYFHLPQWLQPIHLMLSTGTFALLVWALFRTKKLEQQV
jgi:cytochrome c oxidase assembly protein subunit 15